MARILPENKNIPRIARLVHIMSLCLCLLSPKIRNADSFGLLLRMLRETGFGGNDGLSNMSREHESSRGKTEDL